MTRRNLVLWITGRDLLRPVARVENAMVIGPLIECRWEIWFSSKCGMTTYAGPNFIHRWAQRLVLGFHWKMIPVK